jgi:hypothetical protein
MGMKGIPNYVINDVLNVCGYKLQDKIVTTTYSYVDTKYHIDCNHSTNIILYNAIKYYKIEYNTTTIN